MGGTGLALARAHGKETSVGLGPRARTSLGATQGGEDPSPLSWMAGESGLREGD